MLDISCKAHYTYKCKGAFTLMVDTAPAGVTKLDEECMTMKNRIQELRKEKKIRQEDLAEAVGVTRQTIISLENGRYNASLALAHKLAVFFSCTIEDIFIFEEEES